MRDPVKAMFVYSPVRRFLLCSWLRHIGIVRKVPSMNHRRCRRCAHVYRAK